MTRSRPSQPLLDGLVGLAWLADQVRQRVMPEERALNVGLLRSLGSAIRSTIDGLAAEWAVYVRVVGSVRDLAINADRPMDTMSVIKVPVLVTMMRQADAGALDLGLRVELGDAHRRWGTGVLKYLDSGLTLTLRDAAAFMIGLSDNVATDICFEAVGGPGAVTSAMRELGLASIEAVGTSFDWNRSLVGWIDPSARTMSASELFRRGHPAPPPVGSGMLPPADAFAARREFHFSGAHPFGLSSARDMGRLLEMIWTGDAASRTSCLTMLDLLRQQQFTERIPKYLHGAVVAHKTGAFGPFIANDVGLIERGTNAPVLVCVFASHYVGSYPYLEDSIARIGELVWEYTQFWG